MFWGAFSCSPAFLLGGGLSAGGGASINFFFFFWMFIYFLATLRSSGTAGEGTQPISCQPVALKLATIKRFYFGGTRPAVCLLPCLILIQGDNPPGPACLICELLTLHEIPKQSLCPWIAGIFMAESRGLEHNARFRSSTECRFAAQSTDCWGLFVGML